LDLDDGACGNIPKPASSWSSNVTVNGQHVIRQTDSYEEHGDGFRTVVGGSSTVTVNGKALARKGDAISCGANIASGSSDVSSG
jgi:uncharacterized Zn-binding protein involved in type VI secretion